MRIRNVRVTTELVPTTPCLPTEQPTMAEWLPSQEPSPMDMGVERESLANDGPCGNGINVGGNGNKHALGHVYA